MNNLQMIKVLVDRYAYHGMSTKNENIVCRFGAGQLPHKNTILVGFKRDLGNSPKFKALVELICDNINWTETISFEYNPPPNPDWADGIPHMAVAETVIDGVNWLVAKMFYDFILPILEKRAGL